MQQLETSHRSHPHHLSCPRCGHHSVVIYDENQYVCLHCGWRQRVTEEWMPFPVFVLIAIVAFLLAITLT